MKVKNLRFYGFRVKDNVLFAYFEFKPKSGKEYGISLCFDYNNKDAGTTDDLDTIRWIHKCTYCEYSLTDRTVPGDNPGERCYLLASNFASIYKDEKDRYWFRVNGAYKKDDRHIHHEHFNLDVRSYLIISYIYNCIQEQQIPDPDIIFHNFGNFADSTIMWAGMFKKLENIYIPRIRLKDRIFHRNDEVLCYAECCFSDFGVYFIPFTMQIREIQQKVFEKENVVDYTAILDTGDYLTRTVSDILLTKSKHSIGYALELPDAENLIHWTSAPHIMQSSYYFEPIPTKDKKDEWGKRIVLFDEKIINHILDIIDLSLE